MAKSHFNTGGGPSQRQLRVGELIRRRLSEVLQRGEVHDPELQSVPITVGEVRVSPDLRLATAFILPLGGQGAEEILSAMRRNRYELRRAVHKELALKYSPELRFEIDTTFDQMDDTRRMLAEERVTRDVDAPDTDDAD